MSNSTQVIGGIMVTPFASMEDALGAIVDHDGSVRPGFAVAINLEKLARIDADDSFRRLVSKATLRFADGMPVSWALKQAGAESVRIPGCELWEALMERAGEVRTPVFILGAHQDVNARVVDRLQTELSVNVVGAHSGYFSDDEAMREAISASRARVVTVAMGSPRQEEFIAFCRETILDAFFMGVGGSYDVYVGTVQRAPKIMRVTGLEWLYRLSKQPSRLRRYTQLARYAWRHVLPRGRSAQ